MNLIITTLLLTMPLCMVNCFKNKGFRSTVTISRALSAVSTSGKAEWSADDEGPAGLRDVTSQRKLNATLIGNLVSL